MTDASLHTALVAGVPTLAILIGILINNARLTDFRAHMDTRFDELEEKWRAELRIEEQR